MSTLLVAAPLLAAPAGESPLSPYFSARELPARWARCEADAMPGPRVYHSAATLANPASVAPARTSPGRGNTPVVARGRVLASPRESLGPARQINGHSRYGGPGARAPMEAARHLPTRRWRRCG